MGNAPQPSLSQLNLRAGYQVISSFAVKKKDDAAKKFVSIFGECGTNFLEDCRRSGFRVSSRGDGPANH
jgi:hypothetical protein